MEIFSTYSVKIKHYNKILKPTLLCYRSAVDYFINVCLSEWDNISIISGSTERMKIVEHLCHKTSNNPKPKYDFDTKFYKFPSYLRRSAIVEAVGSVSSYKSALTVWEADKKGRCPSKPKAGFAYPCMYRDNMYQETGTYTAKIKVWIRNTWDWLSISLKKSDIDYITRHCSDRKQCAPTLMRRGKEWFLDFPFQETVTLNETPIEDQTVLAVDLGINSAATVSVMDAKGTIKGRYFLHLPDEEDSLTHAVNRIKKAQSTGAKRMPRLWAKAKGVSDDIAVKTAKFIMDKASSHNVDVIVFEHLNVNGKKSGGKKQRLHMWRCQYIQQMVTDKAHRIGMHISRINPYNTSKLAYDGSGKVLRGKEAGLPSYSLCKFTTGKIYNCDLSASYNIGARYFIREILKSLPAKEELEVQAKVPELSRRSTLTFSALISLNVALMPSGISC